MKNIFKKVIASVMAVASLAISVTGMTSSAISENNYAKLTGYRSGSYIKACLLNKTDSSRYGQVACYAYTSTGAYVTHISNSGIIPPHQTLCVESYNFPSNSTYIYEADGTLYLTNVPQGTPLAVLNKIL